MAIKYFLFLVIFVFLKVIQYILWLKFIKDVSL